MAPRKRSALNMDAEDDGQSKIWKVNPPGPEQRELCRMFHQGIIGTSDTPAKIRARNPMLMAFAPRTFALHFRTTKAKYGLNAVATSSNAILELGGFEEELSAPSTSTSPVLFVETQVEAKNFPYMAWTYKDHEDQKEIVCVVVPTVAGSRDIKFVVSDDGMQLIIEYVWPTPLLDPRLLFFDVTDDEGSAISMSDAMVYAYRVRMDEVDLSEKSRPGASLVVNLPLKVQREVGTYKKQALKCGDARIIMVQLTAYQKKRVIIDADTSIKF